MRLIGLSLATCAVASMCLIALFVHALHVPTRADPFIEKPSSRASLAESIDKRPSWPERWAVTHLRAIE
jgi:hypothetical protein